MDKFIEVEHVWKNLGETYKVKELEIDDPVQDVLEIEVPYAQGNNGMGESSEAYQATFQLDEGNARTLHRIIESWLHSLA
jgi:hypothetical protein